MERFAIKIDKSVKARLKNLCRLCGIDNPNQVEILKAEWADVIDVGEATLSCKIYELVGIQVSDEILYNIFHMVQICFFFFVFFFVPLIVLVCIGIEK